MLKVSGRKLVKEENYIYDPSFVKKWQEFYATYGESAAENFKAWIKSNKLNPELPLEPQIEKKLGLTKPNTDLFRVPNKKYAADSKDAIREELMGFLNKTKSEIILGETSANDYINMINAAWQNAERTELVKGRGIVRSKANPNALVSSSEEGIAK